MNNGMRMTFKFSLIVVTPTFCQNGWGGGVIIKCHEE